MMIIEMLTIFQVFDKEIGYNFGLFHSYAKLCLYVFYIVVYIVLLVYFTNAYLKWVKNNKKYLTNL